MLARLNTSARRYTARRQNCNTCLIVVIQKYWDEIFQEDGYWHSKIHCLKLDLLCAAVLGNIFFRFVSASNLVYFSDLLVFNYAYFSL